MSRTVSLFQQAFSGIDQRLRDIRIRLPLVVFVDRYDSKIEEIFQTIHVSLLQMESEAFKGPHPQGILEKTESRRRRGMSAV